MTTNDDCFAELLREVGEMNGDARWGDHDDDDDDESPAHAALNAPTTCGNDVPPPNVMPTDLGPPPPPPPLPLPTGFEWNEESLADLAANAEIPTGLGVSRRGQLKIRQATHKYNVCCTQSPWKIGCDASGEDIMNTGSAGPGRNGYLCRLCGSKWSQIHPAKLVAGQDPCIGTSKRRIDPMQAPRSGGYKCTVCRLPKNKEFAADGMACGGCTKKGAVVQTPPPLPPPPSFEHEDLGMAPLVPSLSASSVASSVASVRTTVVAACVAPVVARMVGGGPPTDDEQRRIVREAEKVNAKAAVVLQEMSQGMMTRVAEKAAAPYEAPTPPARRQLDTATRGQLIEQNLRRSVLGGKACHIAGASRFRISSLADPTAKYMAETDVCDPEEAMHATCASILPASVPSAPPAETAVAPPAVETSADAPEDDSDEPREEEPPIEQARPSKKRQRSACDECHRDCSFVVQCTHKKCRRGACSARCAGFRTDKDMARLGGYKCNAHTKVKAVAFCSQCDAMITDRHDQTWQCVACEDCDESVAWWCYGCAKVTQKIMDDIDEWRCPAHCK